MAASGTILKQHTETEQVILMHELVGLSDDDRDRLIDDFWHEISEDLQANPAFVDLLRSHRPNLPDEPATEQLEAWIELANLLQDNGFRRAVREQLRETCSLDGAEVMTSPEMLGAFSRGGEIFQDAQTAQLSGLPPDSPRGREIADRYVTFMGEIAGVPDSPEFRLRLAADVLHVEELHLQAVEEAATRPDPHTRYQSLVATINGTAREAADFRPYAWLSAALKGSLSPERATRGCPPRGDVPEPGNP